MSRLNVFPRGSNFIQYTFWPEKKPIFWCILIQAVVVKKLGSCQLNIHSLKKYTLKLCILTLKEINLFSLTYLFYREMLSSMDLPLLQIPPSRPHHHIPTSRTQNRPFYLKNVFFNRKD